MNKPTVILSSFLILGSQAAAQAMPDAIRTTITAPATSGVAEADVPEEVLQTEVITSARSPIDNRPLTATEYAELQTEIAQANQVQPRLSSKIRSTIGLLKLRKFIKTVLPFVPIK